MIKKTIIELSRQDILNAINEYVQIDRIDDWELKERVKEYGDHDKGNFRVQFESMTLTKKQGNEEK